MEFDASIAMSHELQSHLQDAMWHMQLRSSETVESGTYPERPGEPDCSYYIRTGLCRFGATCHFNHPPNRKLAIAAAQMKSDFPERVGQPECQYYLKTGTCKFGATCKFHHPREKAGIAGRFSLNILGYPLRPNEPECAYYLRTGHCKFGNTCKFHHPQPTTPGQQSYAGGITNWSSSSYIPSPRWHSPSSYASLILPQGVVSVPGWSAYNDQMGSISTSESQQETIENDQTYGTSHQGKPAYAGSGSIPLGLYVLQSEDIFPERPGEPECQFYMKTGDCKFGAVCRFHHPRQRVIPPPDCILSSIGLPLRPGEPFCVFYSRYGTCKFGPSCKFDHPMGIFSYDISPSHSADASVRHRLGSSSGAAALNLPSQELVESVSAMPRRLSLSETRQITSGDDNIDDEG